MSKLPPHIFTLPGRHIFPSHAEEDTAAYPHKAGWCCWRCIHPDTRSGRSPAGWYKRDLNRPFHRPDTHQYLQEEDAGDRNHDMHLMLVPCMLQYVGGEFCQAYQCSACPPHWGGILDRSWQSSSCSCRSPLCWRRPPLCGTGSSG